MVHSAAPSLCRSCFLSRLEAYLPGFSPSDLDPSSPVGRLNSSAAVDPFGTRRLTPDLHPFLGGTYFPPEDKFGRRGFKSVLKTVASVWRDKEADIRDSAADTVRQLKEMTASDPAASSAGASAALGAAPLMKCAEMLVKRYDEKLGGFGCARCLPRASRGLPSDVISNSKKK